MMGFRSNGKKNGSTPNVEFVEDPDTNTRLRYLRLARNNYPQEYSGEMQEIDLKRLKKLVEKSNRLLHGSLPERLGFWIFGKSQQSIDACIEQTGKEIASYTGLMLQYQAQFEQSRSEYFRLKRQVIERRYEMDGCDQRIAGLEGMIGQNYAKIDGLKQEKDKAKKLQAVQLEEDTLILRGEVRERMKQKFIAAREIVMKADHLSWYESSLEARQKMHSLTEDYVVLASMLLEHAKQLKAQQIDVYKFTKGRESIVKKMYALWSGMETFKGTLNEQYRYLRDEVKGDGSFLKSMFRGKHIDGVEEEPANYQQMVDSAKSIADSL